MLGATKAAKIQEPFGSAREGHAHAIEEIDDRGRHLAHGFCRWLISEKVTAVHRVVKVFPGRIAFTFGVDSAVNPTLRAHRMRTLNRNDREQINGVACLGYLHRRGQSGGARHQQSQS